MRPTFLAFHTASRAMAASQANIDVTGNNIANVNTDGYTRQRVDLNSISGSGYTQKYAVPHSSVGMGVEVNNISQTRDSFMDIRFRNQSSENGRFNTILAGLSDLENIFDEADTEGLQNELSNFINQLQIFSQTPTSKDLSHIVRTAAQKITQILNVYDQQIAEVREQQVYDLSNVVINNSFNTKVKNIASLNTQIREELIHGNTPNELLDKRNTLIDELSSLAHIKVSTIPEKIGENLTVENLSIAIYDTTTGTSIEIVNNGQYNTLSVHETADSLEILINSSFGGYDGKNIADYFSGGSIRGSLDLINGKGIYADTFAGENQFRGTLYYKNTMDTFAANFASIFNELNTNADGVLKPLFSSSQATAIKAGTIRISNEWLADSTYITTTTSGSDTSSGEGDNIMLMISKMNSDINFYRNVNNIPSSEVMFVGTFREYVSGLIGELSLEIELNQNFYDTAQSVLSNLYTSRESISGVSLDEEGINLMAFQKSYQAAARYFTVLDEAVDIIINRMGIAGR